MTTRVKAAVAVAAVVVALFVYFVFFGARRTAARTLTIGTFSSAIDYAPFYVAKHFRWFEEAAESQGYTAAIKYSEFDGVPNISAAFARNDLDVFFSAEAPVIVLRAGGNNVRIVEVSCTLQQEIVVRADLPVRTVADLKGRSVAVLAGTSSHYGLLRILSTNGLRASTPDSPGGANDVQVKFMLPPAANAAFERLQIDAWAVWPPFVERLEVAKKGIVLGGGDAVIQSVMTVPEQLIRDNPSMAKALVASIQRAKGWIATNPEEAQNIVAGALKLDLEVVRAAWRKHNWSATLTDSVNRDVDDKAAFLAAEKVTRDGRRLQVSDLVDAQFVK